MLDVLFYVSAVVDGGAEPCSRAPGMLLFEGGVGDVHRNGVINP